MPPTMPPKKIFTGGSSRNVVLSLQEMAENCESWIFMLAKFSPICKSSRESPIFMPSKSAISAYTQCVIRLQI
jgi:hypothetical protein